METKNSNSRTIFYITEIWILAFHFPRVQILGKSYCGNSLQTMFKRRESFQDVLFHHDYPDGLVASFSHRI